MANHPIIDEMVYGMRLVEELCIYVCEGLGGKIF